MRPPYPNPDAVKYPTGFPLKYPCQMTTRAAARLYPMHQHGAWIDVDGNGNTDLDAGHYHRVRGFRILADESDGHTHEMTTLPCGAGAPHETGRRGPLSQLPDGTYAMVARSTETMAGPLAGGGVPTWVWLAGAVVVVGAIIGGVMLYKHAHEEG